MPTFIIVKVTNNNVATAIFCKLFHGFVFNAK